MELFVLADMPRDYLLGRRSRKDGEEWTCDRCSTVNYPSKHLFVRLPAFRCSNLECNAAPKRVDFRFSFGNLMANEVHPVGRIFSQLKDDCLIFAIAKACEITVAVVRSILGIHKKVPRLDPFSLRTNYAKARVAEGMETDDVCLYDEEAKLGMLELLETVGIQDEDHEECTYRIKSKRIEDDFETVAKALADGYPLVVDIALGDHFEDLSYNKVYKAPYNNERPVPELLPTHAVVLVGAARSGGMDFYFP